MFQFLRRYRLFCIFLAALWAWLFVPSLFNRIMIARNASNYQPAIFTVSDAYYDSGNSNEIGAESFYLIGTIQGHEEIMMPDFDAHRHQKSREALLEEYPKGSTLNVLYNPAMTENIIQNESLRVKHDTGRFWESERKKIFWLLRGIALPFVMILSIYLMLKMFRKIYNYLQPMTRTTGIES